MAKSSKPAPAKSVAFKLFGGLFGTKLGFGILALIAGLIFTAVEPDYLPNLFAKFTQAVIVPVIAIAILVYVGKAVIKKIFG